MFWCNLISIYAEVKHWPDHAHESELYNFTVCFSPRARECSVGPGCALAAYLTFSSPGKRLAYDGHLKSHDIKLHSEANDRGRTCRSWERRAMLSSCANHKDTGSSWLPPACVQTRITARIPVPCTVSHRQQCSPLRPKEQAQLLYVFSWKEFGGPCSNSKPTGDRR